MIQVVVDGVPADLQRVGHGGAVNPVVAEQRGDGVKHKVNVNRFGQVLLWRFRLRHARERIAP